jgi:hypothetical protein
MVSSILDGMNVMSEHFSALYNMLALWGNFIPEWFPTLHLNPVFSTHNKNRRNAGRFFEDSVLPQILRALWKNLINKDL